MAVIAELSPHLADLIAAGEVVERPASAAKELLENAIDAGATQIQVEIRNGGITYLRITDNGCGMCPEDAPIAFRRHATSKLRTAEDLSAIGTLGFRGEALAAICAVSKIDLFTKQKEMLAGIHLHLDGGMLTEQEEAGCPEGTTIIVRDLFFNTPARMKFLKKDFTEAGYVLAVVQNAALSHPEIAFTLIRDGKQVFTTSGNQKLFTPVFAVFGKELAENLTEVKVFERDGIAAWGYLTKPYAGRATRSMQYFFVNGRSVKSKLLQAALEEAYRNQIITGKYPSGVLFLKLPLSQVDVNVHPAKTEVKFAQEKQVFEVLYIACKNALEKQDNIPQLKPKKPIQPEEKIVVSPELSEEPKMSVPSTLGRSPQVATVPPPVKTTFSLRQTAKPYIDADDMEDILPMPEPVLHPISELKDVSKTTVEKTSQTQKEMELKKSATVKSKHMVQQTPLQKQKVSDSVRVLGEVFHTYILAEDKEGVLLIDKHAAHERILFNQMREQMDIPQQILLTPIVAQLTAAEYHAVLEAQHVLEQIGFDLSDFGQNSVAVRAVPAYLEGQDIAATISEMADKLLHHRSPTPDRLDDVIHMVACKAAVKAGMETSQAELEKFCKRVLDDPKVTACPHGRPVTVRIGKYEMDKMFKRVNQ